MNKLVFSGALLGALSVGIGVGLWFSATTPMTTTDNDQQTDNGNASKGEPLYWVAPMDDSYRRDGPGQSPMGMELVPVYAEDEKSTPGDVTVDPTVQHNLGIKLGTVTRSDFHRPLTTTGYVTANQQRLKHYHVRAQGWVSNLSVATEGDPVSEGQKLFEFYSPEIVNIQKEYLQALREQRPELARSSIATLQAKGVSDREIQRLQQTREIRQRLHYYADRDGYVFNLGVREGNFVDLPQNLMSLGTLEDIWVIVEVFERQAGQLEKGQAVILRSEAYPGQEWSGHVAYLYPALNENQRTLRARLVFPNTDGRLKPGMFVQARVDTEPRQAVLTAPKSALIRTGSGTRVVLKTGPERFRSVPVSVGVQGANRVEILAGLSAGDQVVVDGQFLIDSESSREADLDRISASNENHETSMDDGNGTHDAMRHKGMNHEGMNHEGMTHEEMNHPMDHSGEMHHSEEMKHNGEMSGGEQ